MMMKRRGLFRLGGAALVLRAAAPILVAAPAIIARPKRALATGTADVFAFAGQSNMLSFGTLNNTAFPGGWTAAMYGSAYAEAAYNGATGNWVQYVPGSSSYFGGGAQYFGPEAGFSLARRGLPSPTTTYGIKYSIGGVGVAINRGQPGADPGGNSFSPWQRGKAFDGMMSTIAAGCAVLSGVGITPTVRGLVCALNESDCFDHDSAESMEHDLPAFSDRFLATYPGTKIVMFATKTTLGSGASSPSPLLLPYVDIVRSKQAMWAAGASGRALVETNGYASGSDSPGHYDRVAVPTMGTDAFAAFAAL